MSYQHLVPVKEVKYCISHKDILKAAERLSFFLAPSPVISSPCINNLCRNNQELFFKVEALQESGSFKIRGSLNAILSLLEEKQTQNKKLKVITHSSGKFNNNYCDVILC